MSTITIISDMHSTAWTKYDVASSVSRKINYYLKNLYVIVIFLVAYIGFHNGEGGAIFYEINF